MKTIKYVDTRFGQAREYDLSFIVTEYENNKNAAILVMCEDGPYCTLTTNINKLAKEQACYDMNNNGPEFYHWLISNKFISPTGLVVHSGWCEYPIVTLNIEKFKEYKN